jgi:hypothetical protein
MYLPRKTLPDIIDWLWVKSRDHYIYVKLQNHSFGCLEPQREEAVILL